MSQMLQRTLYPTLFLVFALWSVHAASFADVYPGWDAVRLPLVLTLFALCLFLREAWMRIVVYLVFFSLLSVHYVKSTYVKADQLLQYGVLKPLDFFVWFPERRLYTTYRIFPENSLPPDALGFTYLAWDYTYLPFASIPFLFAMLLNVDFRFVLFAVQAIVGLVAYRNSKEPYREILISFILVSPFVTESLLVHHGTNSILYLGGVALVLLSFRTMQQCFVTSGVTLGISALIVPPIWLLLAFLLPSYLAARKALLVAALAFGLCATVVIVPDLAAFYLSTIANHSHLSDSLYFGAGGKISTWTLTGVLVEYFGFDAQQIVETLPRQLIGLVVVVTLFIASLLLGGRRDIRVAYLLGVIACALSPFIIKCSWIAPRYILAPLLCLTLMPSRARWSGGSIRELLALRVFIVLLLASFLMVRGIGLSSYEFEVGEKKAFSFEQQAGASVVPVDGDQIDKPYVADQLSLYTGHGWLSSLFGSQYWLFVPPGRYRSRICAADDTCREWEDKIDIERSFGLRIPFVFARDKATKRIRGTKSPVSLIGPAKTDIWVENATSFSVERLN